MSVVKLLHKPGDGGRIIGRLPSILGAFSMADQVGVQRVARAAELNMHGDHADAKLPGV